MTAQIFGAVLYTDGGAQPNPGFIGWGIHGYIYSYLAPKKKYKQPDKHLITNRGYINPSQTSVSTPPLPELVYVEHFLDGFGTSGEWSTNNVAELRATYHGLHYLLAQADQLNITLSTVLVKTDSQYVKRGVTEWVSLWTKRDWTRADGTPVANTGDWQQLLNEMAVYKERGIEVELMWVEGHQGQLGNETADKLSNVGTLFSTYHRPPSLQGDATYLKVVSPHGYFNEDIEVHPFLNHKRLYFNALAQYSTPGVYYLADPGDDELTHGKRTPDAGYAIVRLKTPDPIVELLRSTQHELTQDLNFIVIGRLDKAFSKSVYPYLRSFGHCAIKRDPEKLCLNFLDHKPSKPSPLTIAYDPPGLSFRAIESFGFLEGVLNDFELFQQGTVTDGMAAMRFTVRELTEDFFEPDPKASKKIGAPQYKLRAEHGVGTPSLMVTVTIQDKPVRIPLVWGLDLITRNHLKRLETKSPKLYLLLWSESEQTVRYATVIQVDDGIGIWSNYFADRIVLF